MGKIMNDTLPTLVEKAGSVIEVIDAHPTGALIFLLIILALSFRGRGPGASK